MVLKTAALGVRRYISHRWNQLDAIIVVLSIAGIILEEMDTDILLNPTLIRVMRIFRIARCNLFLKQLLHLLFLKIIDSGYDSAEALENGAWCSIFVRYCDAGPSSSRKSCSSFPSILFHVCCFGCRTFRPNWYADFLFFFLQLNLNIIFKINRMQR